MTNITTRSENRQFVNPSLLEVSNPPNSDWQHQSWNFNAFHVTDESYGLGSETDCDFLSEWLPSDTGHVGITTTENIPEQAYVPLALSGQGSKLLKQTVEREQEEILVRRRAEGIGFNHIADEISLKTGVKVTRNALVKRYQKILDSYLVVSISFEFSLPSDFIFQLLLSGRMCQTNSKSNSSGLRTNPFLTHLARC